MNQPHARSWPVFALATVAIAAPPFAALPTASPCAQDEDHPAGVESTLARVEERYGSKTSRYERLLKSVAKSVAAVIDDAHPHVQLVTALHDAALDRSKAKKSTREVAALIKAYPWYGLLELQRDLEAAKDRQVPPHIEGFVQLDPASEGRLPGYPELHVNRYLWGTGEIAGWQSLMRKGKPPFRGRKAREGIAPAEALPAHEALRVYLTGNLPATPLLAIPELQHQLHSELVKKRTEAGGERQPMDELFAFFDSKWNGFRYTPVYSKDPLAFTTPLLALRADRHGLPFQFANSKALDEAGDLPITAIQTYVEYSKGFREEPIQLRDLFQKTAEGKAAVDDFMRDIAYLGRYQAMIDILVYSLLAPEIPLPKRLALHDYPILKDHKPPSERKPDTTYDVTRRHALLIWGAFGKDPALVANWLHEKILSKERNAFPGSTALSLPVVLLGVSRLEEKELLEAVARRIEAEREAAGGKNGGPFERQFSPYTFYLSQDGEPNANALANSYHRYHAELAETIAGAALEVVNEKVR